MKDGRTAAEHVVEQEDMLATLLKEQKALKAKISAMVKSMPK